ncbi:MAG: hypothetical protein ABJB86_04700 [Bacteroidota bacterium]
MKKLLLCLFIFPLAAVAQNRYTVSNTPGNTANFKTLQGAHDSVAAGSILYLMPSSYSYGNAVFTKKLTVYGTGYFLGQNPEPNTQANISPVFVNSITFRPGSDNSYLEGLQIAYQALELTNRIVLDTVSNVTISRCLIVSPTYGAYGGAHSFFVINGANNCIIRQCYLQNINGYTVPPLITYQTSQPAFSGVQFINNIIDWQGVSFFRVGPYGNENLLNGAISGAFTNNTFMMDMKSSSFANFSYTNNIIINTVPADAPDAAYLHIGTAFNNISNATSVFVDPANNIQGINTDNMFSGNLAGYHSTDQKWMLRDTSFANTFGQGGTACGAYGGANPYKLSGIPNLPFIYNLAVPQQATAPGSISVHVKARASN